MSSVTTNNFSFCQPTNLGENSQNVTAGNASNLQKTTLDVDNGDDSFPLNGDDLDVLDSDEETICQNAPNSSATAYLRDNFDDHVDWAKNNTTPFSKSLKDSIALCMRLRKTKAALSTCENMMEWHLQCNGQLKKTKRYLMADHVHEPRKIVQTTAPTVQFYR